MSPNFYAIACLAFLLARKSNWLARTCIMKMRKATCVGAQISKVPTRVTILFINHSALMLLYFAMEVLIKYCINSFLKLMNSLDRKLINFLQNCPASLLFACHWSMRSEVKFNWLTGEQKVDQFSIKWIDQLEEMNWYNILLTLPLQRQ